MIQRIRIYITGAVQGVGFRPFIYRLALENDLKGFVNNSAQGVTIEAEGEPEVLNKFVQAIREQKPSQSIIYTMETVWLDPAGYSGFTIRESLSDGGRSALILPDLAVCSDCRNELFDPSDRRYRYPFINCTNCGPRFTIIESLPYDRPNTSMKIFPMCEDCRREYEDPANRRFHAQPNACPVCGPRVFFWDRTGKTIAQDHEAMECTARWILEGRIVAVKGIGGFHLMADARNTQGVRLLRERKHREEKPFAVMMPDLHTAGQYCVIHETEKNLFCSPQAPIVLLTARRNTNLSPEVAPRNPYLGVMLPYAPLHYILMDLLKIPVVATSGNLSDEPICIDEREALQRLQGIADGFLVHNRPIVRHADDSVVRIIMGREYILRRARGYAPLPVVVPFTGESCTTTLAVGAHLKNTIAVNQREHGFISQHIGDLDTAESRAAFERAIHDLTTLYHLKPDRVVCDAHPDYASSRFAKELPVPVSLLQHHVAHILSCMAENDLEPPVLGVAWDGTGYGDDGSIWGGEFIRIDENGYRRLAHLRSFLLAGGDQAVKEPRRSALGVLYEMKGIRLKEEPVALKQAFSATEWDTLLVMLQKQIRTIQTTSAGRLFDAVASLTGLHHQCRFEGQAAMELEFCATDDGQFYPFRLITEKEPAVIDWEPMMDAIIQESQDQVPLSRISSSFHNTLVEMILAIVRHAGIQSVVLSGGCFQNKRLLEHSIQRLRQEGYSPYWHQRVPANDGGISLGQLTAGMRYPALLKPK